MTSQEKIQMFTEIHASCMKAKEEGAISIGSSGVHVSCKVFDKLFERADITKTLNGTYLVKTAKVGVSEPIEFFALYKISDLVNIQEIGEKF